MKTKFFRKVLKNGLTVLLEKRDLPIVSVAYAVRYGGRHELEDEKGIAHFIEHMLFKGTPTRDAKKIVEEIERNGGNMNAFTDEVLTAYWCKMPSKHLGVALDVLTDMVKNSLFDEKELEKERKVIFEEIKMRRDNPKIYVLDKAQSSLYEKPLGQSLIGTEETMNSINRKKILNKFNEVYVPNNLILCVVGDANFDELVKFTEGNFGESGKKISMPEIKIKNKSGVEQRKGIDQANLIFSYHVPLDKYNQDVARVLNVLTAGGMSSRLFSEIREKRNLAYTVQGFSSIEKDFAYNLVYVGTKKENVELVKKLILREFEKISKKFDDGELNQVKEQMFGNYDISMEDSEDQMSKLLFAEAKGDARDFYNFKKRILKVNAVDVRKFCKGILNKNSFFVLIPME